MSARPSAPGAVTIRAIDRDARGALRISLTRGRAVRLPGGHTPDPLPRVGEEWTADLAARVADAAAVYRAKQRALRLLGVRSRSREELRRRLEAGGFAPGPIAAALAALHRSGVIDDAAFAAEHAERAGRRGRSSRALGDALTSAGVARVVIDSAVRGVACGDRAVALRVARETAARLPAALAFAARWRRVMAALARRGFTEEQAQDVVRRVLGDPESRE